MAKLARSLLDASTLCAIASFSGRQAHVNTAYFAWADDFRLIWLSEPGAKHSRNVRDNGSVAIAVFDSHQTWGTSDRGVQLFGSARELKGKQAEAAERAYAKRFPDYRREDNSAYAFYSLRPRRLKLFDERTLGPGVFVTARVAADGELSWERTEVYRATS
ncbi:MAG: hypothetical protein E6F93_07005 [Actinobacteria bacterium]|jgi:uncharacterized protein YhbP (UPF0306 family)|nr:MAG: hypothetical protein E6F93_07005 [Actinomycetota bacterium]